MAETTDVMEDEPRPSNPEITAAYGSAQLGKLEGLMAKSGEYWAARKAADGVELSKDAHDLAAQAGAAVKAGNMPAASQAFDKMGATCNTCHELHLEKR